MLNELQIKCFNKFMMAYWNEMSGALYSDISEAAFDFRSIESRAYSEGLLFALCTIFDKKLCSPIAEETLKDSKKNKFWLPYHRVITDEQCEDAIMILRGNSNS